METVEQGKGESGQMNGHRPGGLLSLLFAAMVSGPPAAGKDALFDVDAALSAVVRLRSEIPADARTAPILGTLREGNGVVIDSDGLVLTIGYLILEAMAVSVSGADGKLVPATVVGFDYDTGFGLVRAQQSLGINPLRIGSSSDLKERTAVLVAGSGGRDQTIGAFVVSRREFAGYWEYLLDEAIFTAPAHPNWGGAALIGPDGKLVGIGSLFVNDAVQGGQAFPGNMFVPIDLLKPILADMLAQGRPGKPSKPWLGMYTVEHQGQLVITQVAPDSPAAKAGLKPGDVVVKVSNQLVRDVPGLYRRIWGLGLAGVAVPFTVLRGDRALDLTVNSVDRSDYLRLKRSY